MDVSNQERITQLLNKVTNGNKELVNELFTLVYEELQKIGHYFIKQERSGHTLNTTSLVHEAYLKLVGSHNIHLENRAHFFAIAALAMRRILVDYARKHCAAKRGGKMELISLEEFKNIVPDYTPNEILVLDEALSKLESFDKQKSEIIEYRFFGGLTMEETATVLNLSMYQVKQEWRLARAWLFREMKGDIS
jgi:RNA polymerase sigma factor (TIGR02999 family)